MVVAGRPRVVEGLRLVRLVGRGGEGEVWEAFDTRGRRRACKLILPEALAAPDEVAERSLYLRRIDHPALVRVHRSGIVGEGVLAGWGFVEMDFVDGASLQRAPADPGVVDRLAQLAEALDLLHAGAWSDGVPLVHRDVKPANLISTTGGRVVLVDASTLRGVDATQLTRIGTPVFSAPEVMTGRIGPPADVYSFAVTVVALVTGARGARLAELVDEAPQLDLPRGVALALSSRPGDRPASCRSVLEPAADIPVDLTSPARSHDVREGGPAPAADDLADDAQAPRAAVPASPPERAPLPASPPSQAGPVPAPPAFEPAHPSRERALWPWVLVLAGLVVVPGFAWAVGGLPRDQLVAGAVGAYGVHLAAHLAARRPFGLAVLLPPLAWAFLLADRAAGPRRLRRGWARALLTGALTAVTVPPVAVVAEVGPAIDRLQAVSICLAGLLLAAAATWAVKAAGAGGVAARLLLLPVWAVGAAVLVAGAVVVSPMAVLAGRGGAPLGVAAGAVAGVGETFRRPAGRSRGVLVPPEGAPPGLPRGW